MLVLPLNPDIDQRHYLDVAASTTVTDEYVPANGEKLMIVELGGSSSSSPETIVKIVWDYGGTDELLYSTHFEGVQTNFRIQRTGDGTKKLAIVLINDLTQEESMGGFWRAVKL